MARITSRITSGITIGISAALFGKEGTPCFDKALLAQLSDHPDIEMVIMEADKTHISAEDAERFDAVYLMLERVTGDAIDTPARKLKLIARHGVGFDTVDIPGVSRLGIIANQHACGCAAACGQYGNDHAAVIKSQADRKA